MSDPENAIKKPEAWKPNKKEWLVMITLAVSSLLVALDSTILVPVLPTLAEELHGSANQAFWAGTAYLLTHAVVQPFIAALSDIFGRRELLLPSLIFFTAGSLVCALSRNFTALLIGRVVQGVGGGGIITLAQLVYADIVPLRQRPKYFTIVLGTWAFGTVLGPFIGGCFVQKATWRWCFYLNLPICAISLVLTTFFVKLVAEHESMRAKIARIDWVGGFLFIASLTSFLIAISWGGVQHSWSSPQTLAPLIVGGVGVIVSLAWEHFFAPHPFLQASLFSTISSCAAYGCALLQGLALYMTMYYVAFYYSAVLLETPIKVGIGLFPGTFFVLPGSAVVSQLITRFGTYRWAIWAGWSIATIGSGILILLDVHSKTVVWASGLSVFGVGMGMVLTSLNFAVQTVAANINVEDTGRAAAMYAFMRSIGMTIGVAVGGTVFQNLMKQKLLQVGLPEQIATNAEAYVNVLKTLSADDPERQAALHAYVNGFKGVFEVMTVVCGAGLLISLFVRHFSMNKLLQSRWSVMR